MSNIQAPRFARGSFTLRFDHRRARDEKWVGDLFALSLSMYAKD